MARPLAEAPRLQVRSDRRRAIQDHRHHRRRTAADARPPRQRRRHHRELRIRDRRRMPPCRRQRILPRPQPNTCQLLARAHRHTRTPRRTRRPHLPPTRITPRHRRKPCRRTTALRRMPTCSHRTRSCIYTPPSSGTPGTPIPAPQAEWPKSTEPSSPMRPGSTRSSPTSLRARDQGANILVLTTWIDHLNAIAERLRAAGKTVTVLQRPNEGARTPRDHRTARRPHGRRRTVAHRRHQLIHRRRIRLSRPGHAVPSRPDHVQESTRPIHRAHHPPLPLARPPRPCTTTTTNSPPYSPRRYANAHPATPKWASPTPES